MTYYLPSGNSETRTEETASASRDTVPARHDIADLKIFWGPEICRLEYLVHLLDTGRVKDEYWPRSA